LDSAWQYLVNGLLKTQTKLSLLENSQLQLRFIFFQVENTEIHAHRNVLASVSPYLMELFSAEQVSWKWLIGCQEHNEMSFSSF